MSHDSRRLFKAGQPIFAEGDSEDIAYIIEEGEVEIWTTIAGKRQTLNILDPGALFGELALVDRQPRSASATAMTDTIVTVVTQQQVDERLVDADPILRMVLFVVMRHFRSEVQRSREQYSPYMRQQDPNALDAAQRRSEDAIGMIKTEAELRAAMKNDEFNLLYQPIYVLATQEIVGIEALIRWKSPSRGDIMPGAFMPLAESTSLIVPIGNWVIETGLKDFLAMRNSSKRELTISFNLARRQMEHKPFLPFLSDSIAAHGIAPEHIKLEMLERNLFKSDQVRSWIKDCTDRGFGILLDDFGTGYSSLQYLQEYQPAALKIDRSFVSGLGVRPESQRICKAIIDLADALGIGAIAEGVETKVEAEMLQAMGCKLAQGFLFSPPVPVEAIVSRLTG
jgi:diguanylate cyclase